jgi:hypothetical protein
MLPLVGLTDEQITLHWKIPTADESGLQRAQISRAHGYAPVHRITLHQRGLPLSV